MVRWVIDSTTILSFETELGYTQFDHDPKLTERLVHQLFQEELHLLEQLADRIDVDESISAFLNDIWSSSFDFDV